MEIDLQDLQPQGPVLIFEANKRGVAQADAIAQPCMARRLSGETFPQAIAIIDTRVCAFLERHRGIGLGRIKVVKVVSYS